MDKIQKSIEAFKRYYKNTSKKDILEDINKVKNRKYEQVFVKEYLDSLTFYRDVFNFQTSINRISFSIEKQMNLYSRNEVKVDDSFTSEKDSNFSKAA